MKTKNWIELFLLFSLAFVLFVPSADAAGDTAPVRHWRVPDVSVMNTGFATEDVSAEKQDHIVKGIGLRLIKADPGMTDIICLDVKEDHTIAVGYNGPYDNDAIGVYSQDGVFQYGYTLDGDGNYCIKWKGRKSAHLHRKHIFH